MYDKEEDVKICVGVVIDSENAMAGFAEEVTDWSRKLSSVVLGPPVAATQCNVQRPRIASH